MSVEVSPRDGATPDGLEALELRISKFLRAGVIVAGVFLALGWAIGALTSRAPLAALEHYEQYSLKTDLGRAFDRGDWARLISYAGLMVLIALPFTRVVLTAVLFVRQREWVLAAIAAFVSVALVGSILMGIDL